MRTTNKTLKVVTYKCICYDRKKKEEIELEVQVVPEVEKEPMLPDNLTLLEKEVVKGSEKEVTFTMTPLEYIKHATIKE